MRAAAAESAAAAERGEFARCVIGTARWRSGAVPILVGPIRRRGRKWAVTVGNVNIMVTTRELFAGPRAWWKRGPVDLVLWGLSAPPRDIHATWMDYLVMILLPQAAAWGRECERAGKVRP